MFFGIHLYTSYYCFLHLGLLIAVLLLQQDQLHSSPTRVCCRLRNHLLTKKLKPEWARNTTMFSSSVYVLTQRVERQWSPVVVVTLQPVPNYSGLADFPHLVRKRSSVGCTRGRLSSLHSKQKGGSHLGSKRRAEEKKLGEQIGGGRLWVQGAKETGTGRLLFEDQK